MKMQNRICRACFMPMLQWYSSEKHISISLVRALAFGSTRHSGRWWAWQAMSHRSPATRQLRLSRTPAPQLGGQESQVVGLLGLKVTAAAPPAAAPPQSQSVLGPTHRAGFGCWLTSYSLCFTTRNRAELLWGKNSLWGETPPSAMHFPCTDALFQASATMADKLSCFFCFSCFCTPLGHRFHLYRSFFQTGLSDILLEPGNPARIMSWLRMAPGKSFATTQQKILLYYKK